MTRLDAIPGIGRTFVRDFARIGVDSVEQLRGRDPETLFVALCEANDDEGHATSKNYLYVLRMAVYYANGGRAAAKLKWSAWRDA
ncbi:MAG: helix-hairpin-helix domain-containing protein [Planctomycetota bacterium]